MYVVSSLEQFLITSCRYILILFVVYLLLHFLSNAYSKQVNYFLLIAKLDNMTTIKQVFLNHIYWSNIKSIRQGKIKAYYYRTKCYIHTTKGLQSPITTGEKWDHYRMESRAVGTVSHLVETKHRFSPGLLRTKKFPLEGCFLNKCILWYKGPTCAVLPARCWAQ